MAKYIATIQDGEGNSVYPQTTTDGVIGLSSAITGAVKDTGLVGTGITFMNGGYDWGVKNGDGTQYSVYRVLTVGKVDIIFLSLDVGYSKDLNRSNEITNIGKLPKIASFTGTNNYIPGVPNGLQWRVLENSIGIKSPDGVIKANTRISLRTLFMKEHE